MRFSLFFSILLVSFSSFASMESSFYKNYYDTTLDEAKEDFKENLEHHASDEGKSMELKCAYTNLSSAKNFCSVQMIEKEVSILQPDDYVTTRSLEKCLDDTKNILNCNFLKTKTIKTKGVACRADYYLTNHCTSEELPEDKYFIIFNWS